MIQQRENAGIFWDKKEKAKKKKKLDGKFELEHR